MSQWQSPNLADETAVNPIVQIHVEKDGRVPAESAHLIQSSGNASYDDSALAAAKNLGYLHEPLPDGCPPDIPITFKLTR
jgi:TonB family protein